MQKATDIYTLSNNLNPGVPLFPADKEFYVPVYNNILNDLRDKILNEQISQQIYFVTGQVGSGKTTALNFLANDEINKNFDVKIMQGRDLFNPEDIDIVDILLSFGYELVKDNEKLQKKFFNKLQEMKKKYSGDLEIQETKANARKSDIGINGKGSIGINILNLIKFNSKFFSSIKVDSETRKIIREIFQFKMKDLLELINNIIQNYYSEHNTGRKILVIIDDLEKLRNPEQIKSIFVENKYYLFGIDCIKIISMPVNLISESSIFTTDANINIKTFYLTILSNPLDNEFDTSKLVEKNLQLLKSIAIKRIAGNYTDLIDDEALNLAIEKSGGLFRQFIHILYNAATKVRRFKGKKIVKEDIISGCDELQSIMSASIISEEKIKLFNKIMKDKIPFSQANESKIFIESLLSNHIILYKNGAPWYEINPIIRRTVEIYGTKIQS